MSIKASEISDLIGQRIQNFAGATEARNVGSVMSVADGVVRIRLHSGRELSFPIKGNPRLEGKTAAQLNHIELSSFGLHWPDLDEDLSLAGIMEGRYGQR